jgi:hypothetical protein
MKRITLERQPGNNGYRVMEGAQSKAHVGYVRPVFGGEMWWAFDLNNQLKGTASNRMQAARMLRS